MPFVSFGNLLGLIGLSSIIILIILYLIKPKPKQMEIPSLMFFIKEKKRDTINSLFRFFVRDGMFLIQLLTLILIALALTSPSITLNRDTVSKNTIFVLDVSGSSGVNENGKTRLEKSIEMIRPYIKRSNTIVTITNMPSIDVSDESENRANMFFKTIKPRATTSMVGDAILLAGDKLGDKKGRVIVFSDFINNEGTWPLTAKNMLESRGTVVNLINTASLDKKNIGIIRLDVEKDSAIAYIKNFNKEIETVKLKINNDVKEFEIKPNNVEPYAFKPENGVTKLELDVEDDFSMDNIAYASMPEKSKIKVLLITNNLANTFFLRTALTAWDDVELKIAEPPIIPKDDYDVYILSHINKAKVVTGTYEELLEKVKAGATVVIAAQSNSNKLGYDKLLPVNLNDISTNGVVSFSQSTEFTKDINIGTLQKYFKAYDKEKTVSIASIENSSVLAISQEGNGKIFYYGIIDDISLFRLSPSYPIFWFKLLNYLVEIDDVADLNLAGGSTLIFDEKKKIKTPTKKINANRIVVDEPGIYEIESKKIAVNLVNEGESDINNNEPIGESIEKFEFQKIKAPVKTELELYIIIVIIIFLILEMIIMKMRGDI